MGKWFGGMLRHRTSGSRSRRAVRRCSEGRSGSLRSHRGIARRGPAPPLRDSLRVDPMAPGQRPYALLTMLYPSTDRLRRAGAPVKNLAHVPSLSMACESVPSYTGTKHLAGGGGQSLLLPPIRETPSTSDNRGFRQSPHLKLSDTDFAPQAVQSNPDLILPLGRPTNVLDNLIHRLLRRYGFLAYRSLSRSEDGTEINPLFCLVSAAAKTSARVLRRRISSRREADAAAPPCSSAAWRPNGSDRSTS